MDGAIPLCAARARNCRAICALCFTHEPLGQENDPGDGRIDAIRFDEMFGKSGACGISDVEKGVESFCFNDEKGADKCLKTALQLIARLAVQGAKGGSNEREKPLRRPQSEFRAPIRFGCYTGNRRDRNIVVV
ncbi:hypothetical protein [Burkholderia sp. BE17]|uniref:hypothetical protein n=1 Tax=Burkholderia sp. BE17 TaxID=2656644 RepID=UPI00187B14AB|nr:hypothetical protein [Burkholderia sp. BE17]